MFWSMQGGMGQGGGGACLISTAYWQFLFSLQLLHMAVDVLKYFYTLYSKADVKGIHHFLQFTLITDHDQNL